MAKHRFKNNLPFRIIAKSFILVCLLFNFTSAQELSAQARLVNGKVTAADNQEGIPGATVIVKGTTKGTATAADGTFSLQVPGPETILVFSSVGYTTIERLVGDMQVINVEMETGIEALDELVVVGYGTQKKVNLTGSVSAMDLDDIENIPAANTGTLLQGRLAGVTVSSFDPQPGRDSPQIRIRGIGTFNAGQEPLVIVDGVQSQLNQIPVSDIKSISVLKDAASAAIYGVRAANGVILVTTKRGKAGGRTNVNFKANYAFQNLLFNPDLLGSADNSTIRNLWEIGEGGSAVYTPEMIQKMRDGSDPDHFADTDWYNEAFRTSPMQTYYMSVDGGNENAQYMISGEFFDQEGILKGTAANRYSLRSNLDIKVNDRFKIGLNAYGYQRHFDEMALFDVSSMGDNSVIYSLRRFTVPTVPAYYSNGSYGFVDGAYPAYGTIARNIHFMAETGENFTDQNRIESRVFGELKILKGLKWIPSFSVIYNNTRSSKFIPTYEQLDLDGGLLSENIVNALWKTNTAFRRNLFENLLTYQLDLDNHSIGVLAGHTAQYERYDYNQGYIENFPDNNIHQLDGGVTNPQVRGMAYEVALESFFGRINYSFMNRYLIEFNVRRDGSSRIPKQNRWGTFPSLSTGWVISEESFLSNLDFISFLKLRGSWGQIGNQEIGNYAFAQSISTGENYLLGGNIIGGVAITELANENLTWETTTIADLGLDMNLLNNRLQLTADLFNKVSSDILIRLPQPRTLGVETFPYQNAAKVKNAGWEVDARWTDNINNRFTYFFGLNFSHVANEILDLAGREDWTSESGRAINLEGYPIGSLYGLVSMGYFQSEQEIAAHASQWGTLAPGDLKYKDVSGPEGEPDGVINSDDRVIIGNPFPEYTYSFNLGASFLGFDFYAFFQGVSNVDRWNWYNTENRGTFTSSIMDYWTPENTDATYWRFGNMQNNVSQLSTFYVTDASYLRLKNLELGYTIPEKILSKVKIAHARVYLSGTNLLTFTDVTEFDPEKPSADERNRTYPSSKTFSIGINVTF